MTISKWIEKKNVKSIAQKPVNVLEIAEATTTTTKIAIIMATTTVAQQ